MNQPWVLIDSSFLAYRALYSTRGLSHDDLPTGVLFGYLTQLRSICQDSRVNSNRVAVFCDSKHSFRKETFKKYKAKRSDKTEEEWEAWSIMKDQRTLLEREILPAMGVSVYRQKGLESDDLIAQAAKQLLVSASFGSMALPAGIMITGDGDLFQCITEVVHWFDPLRGTYYNPTSFKARKDLSPRRWGEVKAIGGCSTDNVPGIPGVGEKTAIQFLSGELPEGHWRRAKIESSEGEKIIRRNRKLVVLPHKRTLPIELRLPQWNPKNFFRLAKRYGMQSFLNDERGWLAFFRGPRKALTRMRGESRDR